jgi:hypothetical protein
MEAAAKVLGHMGKRLRTHEIHLRRAENGYIAKHLLRDKEGNPPSDGQRAEREYTFDSLSNLAAHYAEHMPEKEGSDEDEGAGNAGPMPGA